MNTLATEIRLVRAQGVRVSEEELIVELEDGRTLSVPLAWYPRLFYATPVERQNWRFIGAGDGIHWPDVEEDISVKQLLMGIPSTENQSSLKRWLEGRRRQE